MEDQCRFVFAPDPIQMTVGVERDLRSYSLTSIITDPVKTCHFWLSCGLPLAPLPFFASKSGIMVIMIAFCRELQYSASLFMLEFTIRPFTRKIYHPLLTCALFTPLLTPLLTPFWGFITVGSNFSLLKVNDSWKIWDFPPSSLSPSLSLLIFTRASPSVPKAEGNIDIYWAFIEISSVFAAASEAHKAHLSIHTISTSLPASYQAHPSQIAVPPVALPRLPLFRQEWRVGWAWFGS